MFMSEYQLIKLNDRPGLKNRAAEWFHSKWGIPLEAYRESMEESLWDGMVVPAWYLCMDGDRIVGGLFASMIPQRDKSTKMKSTDSIHSTSC